MIHHPTPLKRLLSVPVKDLGVMQGLFYIRMRGRINI